jgi:hypothetical protein
MQFILMKLTLITINLNTGPIIFRLHNVSLQIVPLPIYTKTNVLLYLNYSAYERDFFTFGKIMLLAVE